MDQKKLSGPKKIDWPKKWEGVKKDGGLKKIEVSKNRVLIKKLSGQNKLGCLKKIFFFFLL